MTLPGIPGTPAKPVAPDRIVGEGDAQQRIADNEQRNLLTLAAHYITLRIAWIFKTESVVMPAFLDAVVGAPELRSTVRGFLPVLNRIGQSIPPLFYADSLRRTPQKKWTMVASALAMAVPFLLLAGTQFSPYSRAIWLPFLFLGLYLLFFSATGVNALAFGTIQGKLIRPHRRGRLMGIAGIAGSVLSIAAAWQLMGRLLDRPDGGFGWIFSITGVGFAVSALICLAVVEPAVPPRTPERGSRRVFSDAWRLFLSDADLRKVVVAAMLFMTAMMLFPHYQALGRLRLNTQHTDLMGWVIAQNAGAGLYSFIGGGVADRFGNRLTVRLLMFTAALTPLAALLLASGALEDGRRFYWITFLLLGMTPTTMRVLTNYTLELAEPEDHPRYISTLKLAMALPAFLSPLAGVLIGWDRVGFEPVFIGVAVLIAAGGLTTFRMAEPRHRSTIV